MPYKNTSISKYGLDRTYLSNAAFTPDTCSPDTSCIHLYPLVSLVAVYIVSCKPIGDMYYPLVSGYKLLVRVTYSCIRLYVSGANAA